MFIDPTVDRGSRPKSVPPWVAWLALSAIYVIVAYYATGGNARSSQVRIILGPIVLAWLVFLSDRTLGRSNPVAAAGFVLGPLAGMIKLMTELIRAARLGSLARDLDFAGIALVSLEVGVTAACVTASVFAWVTWDEWIFYHVKGDTPSEDPDRSVPKCLAEFKLDHNSTLSDLESAYRTRVFQVHPDHGGDAERFKQVERHYADALKLLKVYGRKLKEEAR